MQCSLIRHPNINYSFWVLYYYLYWAFWRLLWRRRSHLFVHVLMGNLVSHSGLLFSLFVWACVLFV